MSKALSIGSAVVPWVLTLFGVPLPGLAEGLSAVDAVVNALPRDRTDLAKFVTAAVDSFHKQCSGEARELGDSDRDVVEELFRDRLHGSNREQILGLALLGRPGFVAAIVREDLPVGWSGDCIGYFNALATQVHGLIRRFAQTPEVLAVAGTAALRHVLAELTSRPTFDEVRAMIRVAVAGELMTRQIIVGQRPRLAPANVAREEMEALLAALAVGGVTTVCAVQGMRGVGKSQLATAVAEQCENNGWHFIGWVTATSRQQALDAFSEIAKLVGISDADDSQQAAIAVVAWLNNAPGDRLLVFDNVDDLDDLDTLIPRGPGMRTIITTTLQTEALGTPIPLSAFTPTQAVDYLMSRTGVADEAGAKGVAEDLGRLPVALAQAAVAISVWNLGFDEYRQLLAQSDLDDTMERAAGDPYLEKVGHALRIGYSAVLKDLEESGNHAEAEAAQRVLNALAILSESGVLRDWLLSLASDSLTARKAVGALITHSVLAESEDRRVVYLHRLQAQVLREDQARSNAVERAVHGATDVLASVDLGSGAGYSESRESMALMASQLADIRSQDQSRPLLDSESFLAEVVSVICQAGAVRFPAYTAELAPYLSDFERVFGVDDPITLSARNCFAVAYAAIHRLPEAIALHRENVASAERGLGTGDAEVLSYRSNLAGAYLEAGDLAESTSTIEKVLAESERILGANHPDTITYRSNLAAAYRDSGKLEQAIALFQSCLADRLEAFGADDPKTISSQHLLAQMYSMTGRMDDAVPMFESIIAFSRRRLGADDPRTLTYREDLAVAYAETNNEAVAVPLLESLLIDRERVLGSEDHATLLCRHNLAVALASLGNVLVAVRLNKENVEIAERTFGEGRLATIGFRDGLAVSYAQAGNLKRAHRLFEGVFNDRTRLLGSNHPDTLSALDHLAACVAKMGGKETALEMLEDGAQRARQKFGPDHEVTRSLTSNLEATRRSR